MSRAMNSLWRSLSGASSKELSHTHPSNALRPTPSMDIEGRRAADDDALRASSSLPANLSLDSAGSLSESLHSSSPTGSHIGAESPTAAQQQNQQQQRRRPYKVHGMDPYDYWSMIKSL